MRLGFRRSPPADRSFGARKVLRPVLLTAILLPAGTGGGPEAVRKALGGSDPEAGTGRAVERRDASPADDRTAIRCGITWRRWAGRLLGCGGVARRPQPSPRTGEGLEGRRADPVPISRCRCAAA
ncbi:hypothetical protein Acsp03_47280 [Actinomadura sp. NBRC 104412]|nr:hypothetical protein Acsp03_47280 [Actinomadura sp. NBRC 104412]